MKRGRPYEMGISENYLKKIIKSYECYLKVEKDFECLQLNLEKNDFIVDNEAFKQIVFKNRSRIVNSALFRLIIDS